MSHQGSRTSGFASTYGVDVKRLAHDSAVLATFLACLVLFAVSNFTMEHFGLAYGESGGGILSKFNPATFLFAFAFVARCFASTRPFSTAWRLLTDDGGVALLLAAATVAFAYAALISNTPVTGIIDTFVLPLLCFVMLRDLDPAQRSWLAAFVLALLAVNALMGIVEFEQGRHFITLNVPAGASADPTRADAGFDWRAEMELDWRATALFGHPLDNGLIVGCAIVCLAAPAARWIGTAVRLPLLGLLILSMFAFGARVSLVLALAAAALLLLQSITRAVTRGARLQLRHVVWAGAIVLGVIVAVGLLSDSGFFDRTIARFVNDEGSALARVRMLELFRPLSWSDILLGPNQDVVVTQRRLQGLEFGIESPWVGFVLVYGLVVTTALGVGLVAFLRSVARQAGQGAVVVLIVFLLAVSTSASLTEKTKDVAVVAAMVMLLLPKRDPAPSV